MLPLRTGIRTLLVVGASIWAVLRLGACAPDPLSPPPAGPAHAWRLVNPRPFDVNITDVWGIAPTRMFAVGLYGALLVRDPAGWRQAPAFTSSHIHDIHGCDPEHVWAVAEEGLFRFDGRHWRREGPADLFAESRVWCNGPDDVMVVTGQGFSHHWDGRTWRRAALDVWPSTSPGDWLAGAPDGRYLAVGRGGRHAFWQGGAWQLDPVDGPDTFEAVLFVPDEFGGTWLAATEDWGAEVVRIMVRDRGGWSTRQLYENGLFVGMETGQAIYRPYVITSPRGTNDLEIRGGLGTDILIPDLTTAALAVYRDVAGDDDTLVLGAPFGTVLTGRAGADALDPVTASIPFAAAGCMVWPNGDFAAFDEGSVLHGRGGTLRREPVPVFDRLTDVWGPAPGTLYAVGTGGLVLLLQDGEAPRLITLAEPGDHFAVRGSGPDDVWIGGDATAHWDGEIWTTVPWPLRGKVLRIRGRGPDEVYASSEQDLARWDGAAWVTVGPPDAVGYFGLDLAPDSGDVYVVARSAGSQERRLLRRRDGVWEDCGAPSDNADDIVALPGEAAYVATFESLRRWDRGVWTSVPYPLSAPDAHPWSALGGDPEGGIYAGFNTGGFYHLDLEGRGLWR